MDLVRNISISELKSYVTASRACKFGQTYELDAKFGALELDFSVFNTADICNVYVRRKSGNGQSIINDKETSILSKSRQNLQIQLDSSKKLIIKRTQNSLGIIEILSIDLYTSGTNGESKVSEWKNTLNRCKSYKCIRIVDGRLYASEGALVEADNIAQVSTNPPNMFKLSDGNVKFLGTCEITELQINSERQNVPVLYQHIGDAPAPITLQPIAHKVITSMTNEQSSDSLPIYNVLYEAAPSHLFRLNAIKDSKFNGKSIILGVNGKITIPIQEIHPNSNYIVIIEASKTIGNGKLTAYIQSAQGVEPAFAFCSEVHRAINLRVSSSNIPEDGMFKLVIARPDSSTGEVAISKVILIADQNYKLPIKYRPPPYQSPVYDDNSIKSTIISNKLAPVKLRNEIDLRPGKDRKFVIIIPSYNNEGYVVKNLESALSQSYKNYRVIYIDDCSSDSTFETAKATIDRTGGNIRTNLVKNLTRVGALENLYNAIHSCADDEIVLTLDGDDWLAHNHVLNYLNQAYNSGDVWMTYGQYENSNDRAIGTCQQIPNNIIDKNGFRGYAWCSSHLRTFYAWLFKKINRDDLMADGRFYSMTWDFAMMFPMLEMAGQHSRFMNDILYIYNLNNPLNDHKVDRRLQAQLDKSIRNKQKYNTINISSDKNPNKTKIGLLLISTGKYHSFIDPLISSADRYFFNTDDFEVSYFLFSDKEHDLGTHRNVTQIHIDHVPFPYATMDRFKHFTNNSDKFDGMDYLYYVDIDCLFMNAVSSEALGDLVGVRHCGYYSGGGTFENNTKSVFCRPLNNYKHYYGGGYQGGKKENYLQLAKWCYEKIEEDLKNNIIPIYHDETALNTYFSETPPTIELSPQYHYPQNAEHFIKEQPKMRYLADMLPIILLLEKDHKEIRS